MEKEDYNIPFTQYLMPDGRQREVMFQNDDKDLKTLANELIDSGAALEAEILPTGLISLTVEKEDETLAHEICKNGTDVIVATRKIIERAHKKV